MQVYRMPDVAGEQDLHLWTTPTPNGSFAVPGNIECYIHEVLSVLRAGQQVQIVLEELKTEYGRVFVASSGDQKKPRYLALNPNGKMPTILDKSRSTPVFVM
ncbi:hypothetical protein FRC07_000335 [Ceratobasidium sp. 392]|nr:hypothetical protein FRC07_000335 [Ceratobasidium sp. 392]